MLERVIRKPYQIIFVDWIAKRLIPYVTPMHVTFAAGMFGLITLFALMLGHSTVAVIFMLLSGYCDTLDGTLARITQSSTAVGSVLDIFMDRCVELFIILGIWSVEPTTRSLLCLLMLGSIFLCVTSFLVVGIFTPNESEKGFYYSPGLIERAEAFAFFIALILMPQHFTLLASFFCILVMMTTVIRLYEFYRSALRL